MRYFRRGVHRQNGFRQTVDELERELSREYLPHGQLGSLPIMRRSSDGELFYEVTGALAPMEWDPEQPVIAWIKPPAAASDLPALVNS